MKCEDGAPCERSCSDRDRTKDIHLPLTPAALAANPTLPLLFHENQLLPSPHLNGGDESLL